MYMALSDEQELLSEAATGMLERAGTLARARDALDSGQAPPLWDLAVEAGWPGLLVGEDADGAGLGAAALLVLEQCGAALADARLLGHTPACALLELTGADPALRARLAAGDARAALVDGALGHGAAPLRGRADGDLVRFDGTVDGVLDAPGADVLVVVGVDAGGAPLAGILAPGVGGVAVARGACYDATRMLASVHLDRAAATRLPLAADGVGAGRDLQRALLAAESLGAADACLRMARDYAIDRRAFGRPIGSYQAIKHKLVEMLRRIESARSLVQHAGAAWHGGSAEFSLAANAARVIAADALDFAAPENIFIHGGIGATWEHDAQLYYRRAEVARRLAGGCDAAAAAVADELFARILTTHEEEQPDEHRH
jgi:alkylation response protein AidB-like acyl-CoA dehydrogenase